MSVIEKNSLIPLRLLWFYVSIDQQKILEYLDPLRPGVYLPVYFYDANHVLQEVNKTELKLLISRCLSINNEKLLIETLPANWFLLDSEVKEFIYELPAIQSIPHEDYSVGCDESKFPYPDLLSECNRTRFHHNLSESELRNEELRSLADDLRVKYPHLANSDSEIARLILKSPSPPQKSNGSILSERTIRRIIANNT